MAAVGGRRACPKRKHLIENLSLSLPGSLVDVAILNYLPLVTFCGRLAVRLAAPSMEEMSVMLDNRML
jgi:hypothetical protein